MSDITPHVSEVIEPGAILYSSWGYDQTNVDFYMVTRTTKASAWIVPMSSHETQTGFMSGQATPGEPRFVSEWCECDHRVSNHGTGVSVDGPDFSYCRGAYGDECDCEELRPRPLKPAMHRIQRTQYSPGGALSLSSYANAYLWDGASKYASHYA